MEILKKENEVKLMTTFRQEIEVLGEGKIKIIEVILAALKLDKAEIFDKIYEIGAMKVFVDLFFKFE